MRPFITGLRARMRKVDHWIEEEGAKAFWRRISRMSIEEKREFLREMLPTIPVDHPARAAVEEVVRRSAVPAGRRPE